MLLLNSYWIKSSEVCAFSVCARLRSRCVNYTPVLFRMAYDIENTVINDVLCYLSTSKKALSCENVILNAVAFYKSEAIRKAKEFIFECCKEKLIVRKSCASHPNPAVADVQDILDLIDKSESNRHLLPEFVAAAFTSMPPSTGFESLAMVMCSLRDEVAALRLEVTEVRQVTQKDLKSLEGVGCVIQDVAEVKTILHNHLGTSNPLPSYAGALHTGTSSESVPAEVLRTSSRITSQTGVPTIPLVSNSASNRRRRTSQNISGQNVPNVQHNNGTDPERASVSDQNHVRRFPVRRRTNIAGTRVGGNGLSGVQRVLDVFVGGCEKVTTESNIKEYCAANNVTILKCESVVTKSEWYNSFKVSVYASVRDQLLEPEFWAHGVFVRKYFKSINHSSD